jgi:hypothetical protein
VAGWLTWSEPSQVNQAPDVQAFNPSVAVGANGVIGISYYDFRKDTDDRAVLLTTVWRLFSADGGTTWMETPLSAPFDLAKAPVAAGAGYFVGDYQGLVPYGGSFLAFFAAAAKGLPGDVSDVFAAVRAAPGDRTSNGRVEINRHLLRLRERPTVPRK